MFAKHPVSIFWDHVFDRSSLKEKTSKITFLQKIPVFDGLSYWQLNQMLNIIYERSFDVGEYVFQQGQPGAALFIVLEGQVAIDFLDDGRKIPYRVAELGNGAFFGEMALIDGSPRSATAR